MRTPEQLEAENRTLKVYASTLEQEKKSLAEEKAELEVKLKWYEEQLKLNKKKMYGASSEKTESDGEQLNLFNEAEAERAAISIETTVETITYKPKKSKGHREKLLAQCLWKQKNTHCRKQSKAALFAAINCISCVRKFARNLK